MLNGFAHTAVTGFCRMHLVCLKFEDGRGRQVGRREFFIAVTIVQGGKSTRPVRQRLSRCNLNMVSLRASTGTGLLTAPGLALVESALALLMGFCGRLSTTPAVWEEAMRRW